MKVKMMDINIYRDGGSVDFYVNKKGRKAKYVWLDTPFRGEPRQLQIDHQTVLPGDQAISDLLADIDMWFLGLPHNMQTLLLEMHGKKGVYYDPSPELLRVFDFCHVFMVRDYVLETYVVP